MEIIKEKFDEIADDDQKMFQNEKNLNILPPEVKAAVKDPTSYTDIMEYIQWNVSNIYLKK